MEGLPLSAPIAPMLARRAETIPLGPPGTWRYETKLDGIRAIVFRSGASVLIHSRAGNDLTGFFPEVADAVRNALPERCIADGELVVTDAAGTSFRAVMRRLGVRPERAVTLARSHPALLVLFDLLALGDEVLMTRPFHARRERLEAALPAGALALAGVIAGRISPNVAPCPVQIMPQTDEHARAGLWLSGLGDAGVEGIVAKPARLLYRPGRREMIKVKRPLAGGR